MHPTRQLSEFVSSSQRAYHHTCTGDQIDVRHLGMGHTITAPAMRKVLLLYNPASGVRKERRRADVEAVIKVLREAGLYVEANTSGGPDATLQQVRQAIAEGFDSVFACGGDGTINDVLQGLVGKRVALGVIPVGTANTLAHDIGLPLHPVKAARALLQAVPLRLAAGQVAFQNFEGQRVSRYFTVAVGVGVDAHLFYKLNAVVKSRMGMTAYYGKAARLWLTHKMRFFDVEYLDPATNQNRRESVSELLAVRITEFGGILREFAPGASLKREDHRLVLFKTASRLLYLAYIARGLLRARWRVAHVELQTSARISCRLSQANPSSAERIFVEADGELVGTLPADVSIVRDAFTLLVPERFA
jgi:diacylglycerol kinase (ATP)